MSADVKCSMRIVTYVKGVGLLTNVLTECKKYIFKANSFRSIDKPSEIGSKDDCINYAINKGYFPSSRGQALLELIFYLEGTLGKNHVNSWMNI